MAVGGNIENFQRLRKKRGSFGDGDEEREEKKRKRTKRKDREGVRKTKRAEPVSPDEEDGVVFGTKKGIVKTRKKEKIQRVPEIEAKKIDVVPIAGEREEEERGNEEISEKLTKMQLGEDVFEREDGKEDKPTLGENGELGENSERASISKGFVDRKRAEEERLWKRKEKEDYYSGEYRRILSEYQDAERIFHLENLLAELNKEKIGAHSLGEEIKDILDTEQENISEASAKSKKQELPMSMREKKEDAQKMSLRIVDGLGRAGEKFIASDPSLEDIKSRIEITRSRLNVWQNSHKVVLDYYNRLEELGLKERDFGISYREMLRNHLKDLEALKRKFEEPEKGERKEQDDVALLEQSLESVLAKIAEIEEKEEKLIKYLEKKVKG